MPPAEGSVELVLSATRCSATTKGRCGEHRPKSKAVARARDRLLKVRLVSLQPPACTVLDGAARMGSHIPRQRPENACCPLEDAVSDAMRLHRPVARSGRYTLDEVSLLLQTFESANIRRADPASCWRALPPSTIHTLSKHAMPLQFLLADGHIRPSTMPTNVPTFPHSSVALRTAVALTLVAPQPQQAPLLSLTRPTIPAALHAWPALIALICCKERHTAAHC